MTITMQRRNVLALAAFLMMAGSDAVVVASEAKILEKEPSHQVGTESGPDGDEESLMELGEESQARERVGTKSGLAFHEAKKMVQEFWAKRGVGGQAENMRQRQSVLMNGDGTLTNEGGHLEVENTNKLIREGSGRRRRRRCTVKTNAMPCPDFYDPGDMDASASVGEAQKAFMTKCQKTHSAKECKDLSKDTFHPLGTTEQCFKDQADAPLCKLFDSLKSADDAEKVEEGEHGKVEEDENTKSRDELLQRARAKSGNAVGLDASVTAKCGTNCVGKDWNSCARRRDCTGGTPERRRGGFR